jgi:hypothetical protein
MLERKKEKDHVNGKSVFFIPQILQKCNIHPSYFIWCKSTPLINKTGALIISTLTMVQCHIILVWVCNYLTNHCLATSNIESIAIIVCCESIPLIFYTIFMGYPILRICWILLWTLYLQLSILHCQIRLVRWFVWHKYH